MTKIDSIPPYQPPEEPPRPQEGHKGHRRHHHHKAEHGSRAKSHSRQLRRFAKAQASSISFERAEGADQTYKYNWSLSVPYRHQWNENNGYCGECAQIAAGMYYGQYCSQYDARQMAYDNTYPPPKDHDPQHQQLLLGINDSETADAMKLNSVEYNGKGKSAADCLVWVKQQIKAGHPVSLGLFNNEYQLYGNTDPDAGDAEYDHIVSVVGIKSNYNDGKYHPDDKIIFSDNGLFGKNNDSTFTMTFAQIQANREQANAPDGNLYSLKDNGTDFAIAYTGVQGSSECLPVSIASDKNYELPEIGKSDKRPKAESLNLTVTISGLKPHTKYIVYQYDDFSKVPTGNFNKNSKGVKSYEIEIDSGSTYSFKVPIQSDQEAIFRAVPESGP